MKITSVILAAGKGTRMRSDLPKVLHPLLGKPMFQYAIETARQVTGSDPLMVIGHEAEAVRKAVGSRARLVVQEPQLGTGHAVQQSESMFKERSQLVLVTSADMPLLTPETLNALVEKQVHNSGPFSMLTVIRADAGGFGRVIRDEHGQVVAIVEEAQATQEQLAIQELNVGAYCFDAQWLFQALPRIPLSPKGEYYLTDLVAIAVAEGTSVQALVAPEAEETIGINTRVHLAEAQALLRQRINRAWMLAGVTLEDPSSTYIEPDVRIGQDTVILPNSHLQGSAVVGKNCIIGPNSVVKDTSVGDRCKIRASVLESAVLEDDVDVGPFAHLRKGAYLAMGVHMGNFGEIKNSYLGAGTKMGHFSYMGDATVGPGVNIGAGTITCNYDGREKHPTEIGEDVFIGSDTMLVAPVRLGKGARTGAGAVVTKDVAEDTLAVGVPARSIRKLKKGE
ncbi:MAG: bifunctional UDP-N-acetylglucosamine diphosphorylase/glucosamine-1-phosphate N-acetyltransferase GlmU [Anaerolineales bacterium]|jgi:bifunctional UDP-N-acetylglucosamine pyrophosphorylase/glucosamine-1-phosphate N-acetyltransferase